MVAPARSPRRLEAARRAQPYWEALDPYSEELTSGQGSGGGEDPGCTFEKTGIRRLEVDLKGQRRHEDVCFATGNGCGPDTGNRDPRQKNTTCISSQDKLGTIKKDPLYPRYSQPAQSFVFVNTV